MKRRHCLPAEVYALVDATPATVLLEGTKTEMSGEPWTRLFTAPLRMCVAHQPADIPSLFNEVEEAVRAGHYAAGFFSYECGQHFEPKAALHQSPDTPLAWLGIYERSYRFDHATGQFIGDEPPGLAAFRNAIDADESDAEPAGEITAEFTLTEPEYAARIDAIREWIRAGDVYQLNFTAPWRVETRGRAAQLYARLRARQPAPYGAFLHLQPERRVLSFSPELFFRVDEAAGEGGSNRRITTRPMKGTASRGRSAREDRERAEWLRTDEKNRSENVMIVDLLRNDLGRIASFGSVRVAELLAVERYPTLWQMTSTVTAELRAGIGYEQIFRALFPCGSITGAPKVRAMQLIAGLEGAPRGVYTGAIGFFSPQRTEFNVAIRTLALHGTRGTMCTGSGIVIDSAPAEEYRECLLKARFLTESPFEFPAEFSLIETMLWDGLYPLIELHLDRLTDSAAYFGFVCDRAEVRSALEKHAQTFTDAARKVRLLVNRYGNLTIADEALPTSAAAGHAGRVCISPVRTDSADPALFHKTTHRTVYTEAFRQASREGFDDVLFFNQRDELTEGAISNIFVEMHGRLLTPPIECGLLAGVCRRHLLEARTDVAERVLHDDDLRHADAIYLANAVRGLRRVQIDWKKP